MALGQSQWRLGRRGMRAGTVVGLKLLLLAAIGLGSVKTAAWINVSLFRHDFVWALITSAVQILLLCTLLGLALLLGIALPRAVIDGKIDLRGALVLSRTRDARLITAGILKESFSVAMMELLRWRSGSSASL